MGANSLKCGKDIKPQSTALKISKLKSDERLILYWFLFLLIDNFTIGNGQLKFKGEWCLKRLRSKIRNFFNGRKASLCNELFFNVLSFKYSSTKLEYFKNESLFICSILLCDNIKTWKKTPKFTNLLNYLIKCQFIGLKSIPQYRNPNLMEPQRDLCKRNWQYKDCVYKTACRNGYMLLYAIITWNMWNLKVHNILNYYLKVTLENKLYYSSSSVLTWKW